MEKISSQSKRYLNTAARMQTKKRINTYFCSVSATAMLSDTGVYKKQHTSVIL